MSEVSTNICENRKAWHDFEIIDTIEAGIELKGTEVKSLRTGRVDLRDCYALVKGESLFIIGLHIPPYSHGNIHNVDPDRTRRLLLHRVEINRLIGKTHEGFSLIPINLHWNAKNLAKVSLAVAKPKKLHDKRVSIKKKEADREMGRALKWKN